MFRPVGSGAIAARCVRGCGWLVLEAAAAALLLPSLSAAQNEAPGEAVVIPGATIPQGSRHVPGRFGPPTSWPRPRVRAV